MRFGKRRKESEASEAQAPSSAATPVAPPVSESWTMPPDEPAAYSPPQPAAGEPVVEGEAIELPASEFHQPVPPTGRYPEAASDATGFADQPVAVATGSGAAPATPLRESGAAFASGHGAGPSWQEPVMELANERPELVVAAAFAGGVLAAMILRRLGD